MWGWVGGCWESVESFSNCFSFLSQEQCPVPEDEILLKEYSGSITQSKSSYSKGNFPSPCNLKETCGQDRRAIN